MLTVVHDAEPANELDRGVGRSLLDEIVRDGARQMPGAALQAEVAAYVEQFADQVDEHGRRLVVRNGHHHEREVLTAAGAVRVTAPRVNDHRVDADTGERQRFSSAILPAWARKSPQLTEVLPLLYLHGLSTSEFRTSTRTVPGFGGRAVGDDDYPADRPVARRSEGLRSAGVVGHRLRVPVGRWDPPQGRIEQ